MKQSDRRGTTPEFGPTEDTGISGGPGTFARSDLNPRERFLNLDRYRVEREWQRYQGTPQRDLFRELRERFLRRNAAVGGTALEIGPGPGRFSPLVGGRDSRRVLLDLSLGMLQMVRETWPRGPGLPPFPQIIRGDGTRPPFPGESFDEVVALGNPLGFSGEAADQFLRAALALVAPGGRFLIETVGGFGERSRYLTRLPPKAVRRLLAAPVAAVEPRVQREGFHRFPVSIKASDSGFRRFGLKDLVAKLEPAGFRVTEVLAVAPCLGSEAERVTAVSADPAAWAHLLALEERLGRDPPRLVRAAALLVAATRG